MLNSGIFSRQTKCVKTGRAHNIVALHHFETRKNIARQNYTNGRYARCPMDKETSSDDNNSFTINTVFSGKKFFCFNTSATSPLSFMIVRHILYKNNY